MSGPRLTFLYPQCLKSARSFRPTKKHIPNAGFKTAQSVRQENFPQRYGPAAEQHFPPSTQPPIPDHLGRDDSLANAIEKEVNVPQLKDDGKKTEAAKSQEASRQPKTPQDYHERGTKIQNTFIEKPDQAGTLTAGQNQPLEIYSQRTTDRQPLETVLRRGEGAEGSSEVHKPPHLQAPPYVHHFDTFTLVHDLEKGGFTQDQSVTLMKAVRGLLTVNSDIARDGLISKSDVENEIYLFRAACSELRTEILNTRKTHRQRTSSELSHLQHQVDILSQKLTQESSALKEDLRGMLNDRKMAVRMEQQAVDQAIQELNYKITVKLISDSKSQVEGLRWVLTRRTAMALATMAVLILGSLRWSTYQMRVKEMEKVAEEKKAQSSSFKEGKGEIGGGGYTVSAREVGTQTGQAEAMLVNASATDSPAYVSLG
ncbi:MAG: hypothetical protein LQ342_005271 [Letrouitia transgressa]|nr:MAG: hypothetical protein LQ342_005271 [Letrouitia transgressa]